MLTACGQRVDDRSEAAEPTFATKGGPGEGADEQPKIEQIWKEQDRIVHEHLDGYGWVDRVAGIVHIPIDRAMDLIVAEKKSSGPASDQTSNANSSETNTALQNTGRRLFRQYGCTICHDPDAVSHAPSLIGIHGQRVRLSDGTFVRADDQYLHDSIMSASKQVVAGYVPVMPAYGSIIPEPDVRELIAYLKSTSPASTPVPAVSR
jgi:mono/diheme cytochrome c family protein